MENERVLTQDEIKSVKGRGFLNQKGTDKFNARVVTVNGKITSEQCRALADAADEFGSGEVAFTTRLSAEVQGIPFDKIDAFCESIGKVGLEAGGTGPKVRPIVSCKGTTCQYGLCDTYALSEKVHKIFYKGYGSVKLPHKFKIAVGGCPNNCVKPNLNDVGISGRRIPQFNADKCRGCKVCAVVRGLSRTCSSCGKRKACYSRRIMQQMRTLCRQVSIRFNRRRCLRLCGNHRRSLGQESCTRQTAYKNIHK